MALRIPIQDLNERRRILRAGERESALTKAILIPVFCAGLTAIGVILAKPEYKNQAAFSGVVATCALGGYHYNKIKNRY